MFCEKCGREISEDSMFCEFCGAVVQHDEDIISQSVEIIEQETAKPKRKSRKKFFFILIAIVAIVVAIVISIFVFKPFGEKNKDDSNEEKINTEITTQNTEIDSQTNDSEIIPEGAIEYNGHHYKVYNEAMYWSESKEKCEEKNGHLATVTSEEEQKFIEGLIEKDGAKKSYWLGGTDEASEGSWTWVTDELWEYSNWREGQPNNRDNVEVEKGQDYLEICCGSTDVDRYMLWWDATDSGVSYGYEDYPDYKDTQYHGYICEWEE